MSLDSDGMQGSGLDDVTDTARANAAKLERDDAICSAGEGPGMGGALCDEGTVSGGGDVTSYVDAAPGMGDEIGNANPKAVRVCDGSKFTGARGVSFASVFGMIPGATLVRLAREQAQLLDRKVLPESVCQPTAGAGGTSSPLAEILSEIRSKISSRLALARRQGYLSPALLPQGTHSFHFAQPGTSNSQGVPPPWFREAPLQAFTGRDSDLDTMSRSSTDLSSRFLYLIERDPDEYSPNELAVEISEVESMWRQVWGVLQRIYTIEDLILMSPDPDNWQWLIKEMSFLLFRLLLYTNRGLEQLCAPVIRKGLNEASVMLDGFLEDGDSIGSSDGAEGICSSANSCCDGCCCDNSNGSSVEGDKESNNRIGSGGDLGGYGYSIRNCDSEVADTNGDECCEAEDSSASNGSGGGDGGSSVKDGVDNDDVVCDGKQSGSGGSGGRCKKDGCGTSSSAVYYGGDDSNCRGIRDGDIDVNKAGGSCEDGTSGGSEDSNCRRCGDLGCILWNGDIRCAIDGTKDDTDVGGDSSRGSESGTSDGNRVQKARGSCGSRGRNVDPGDCRRIGRRRDDNGGGEYALISGGKSSAGASRTTDDGKGRREDYSCITSNNSYSTSRGDYGRNGSGGLGCGGHDASGDCNTSDRGPGSGGIGGCGIDSGVEGRGVAAGGRNGALGQSEPGPSAWPVPSLAAGSWSTGSIWAGSVSRVAKPSSACSTQVEEPASLESVPSRPASSWAGSGPPTSSSFGSMSVRPVSAIPIATILTSVVSGSDGPVTLGTGSRRIHEELPDTGQGRSGPAESTNFAQSDMNADLLAGMVLCLLALSGAAFGYYLTVSVVMLLLLFNNTFFACFNSRTVKRWFTKKGGRLKPDKTAREGEDPFKVSGREILANMDRNTKQALRKAKQGLRNSLSGAISYIPVASLVLIVIFRVPNGDARPGKGNCDLFGSGGSDGLRWRCGEGGGDRLGSGNGDGLGCGGGKGLGPGRGGRLRLGGSDRLGGGQKGYSSDHLECDGSERLGCTGSYQLGSRSDDHIGLGCEELKRAGNRSIDGGGPVGHRSRLGDGGGKYGGDDRESDGGWTKADRDAAKRAGSKVDGGKYGGDRESDAGWTKADRDAGKRVGSKVDQKEKCGSALLPRIVFDKDNPEGWWNTVQSVAIMRE